MNEKYIDLHIHSIYSDGDNTPKEIIEMAEDLQLKYISITDHENCKAYEEIKKITNQYHVKIITGCELMTSFNNTIIEILGYHVNPQIINDWYNKTYAKEEIEKRDRKLFKRLMQKIKEVNLKTEKEVLLPKEIPYTGYFKLMTYEALKRNYENKEYFRRYEINNYEDFIRKGLSNQQNPLYIGEADYIAKIQDIINLIHRAGGLAFVAHLYKYQVDNHIKFLNNMIETVKGIDGIECNYSSFSKEQTKELEEFCENRGLFKSGGSDYHGKLKANIQMGRGTKNCKIEEKIIEKWAKR